MWEYTVRRDTWIDEGAMNRLGAMGWELVSVTFNAQAYNATQRYTYFFKRLVEGEPNYY